MRGLYRYKIANEWWVCAEEDTGQRVSIIRTRYVMKDLKPPFGELPVSESGQDPDDA